MAPCLWIKMKTINLKQKSNKPIYIDMEEDWFPYLTGQTFCRTDQWYFPVNWRRTRSQIWNLEPSSTPKNNVWMRACVYIVIVKYFSYIWAVFISMLHWVDVLLLIVLNVLCKWWARKQISLHRDNKVVLYIYIYISNQRDIYIYI